MRLAAVTSILAALTLGLGACHAVNQSVPDDSPGKNVSQAVPDSEGVLAKTHLYIYLGRTQGQLFSYPNWHDSDFYINGINVGTISTGEYLAVDLEPGVYAFQWRKHHGFVGKTESSSDYDMLQPGEDVFLALNINLNAGAWIPPLGWWLDPDTAHIADTAKRGRLAIADKQPLRLSSTIMAQLRPLAGPATYLPTSW